MHKGEKRKVPDEELEEVVLARSPGVLHLGSLLLLLRVGLLPVLEEEPSTPVQPPAEEGLGCSIGQFTSRGDSWRELGRQFLPFSF